MHIAKKITRFNQEKKTKKKEKKTKTKGRKKNVKTAVLSS